jgi:hypothetical protein
MDIAIILCHAARRDFLGPGHNRTNSDGNDPYASGRKRCPKSPPCLTKHANRRRVEMARSIQYMCPDLLDQFRCPLEERGIAVIARQRRRGQHMCHLFIGLLANSITLTTTGRASINILACDSHYLPPSLQTEASKPSTMAGHQVADHRPQCDMGARTSRQLLSFMKTTDTPSPSRSMWYIEHTHPHQRAYVSGVEELASLSCTLGFAIAPELN